MMLISLHHMQLFFLVRKCFQISYYGLPKYILNLLLMTPFKQKDPYLFQNFTWIYLHARIQSIRVIFITYYNTVNCLTENRTDGTEELSNDLLYKFGALLSKEEEQKDSLKSSELPAPLSQAQKRDWKRDNEVWSLCNIWGFQHGCQQICRWTMGIPMHMHSGFPTVRLEQMIMMPLYDVMRISHAEKGGNYNRRGWLNLGLLLLLSGCSGTKHLGLLASHRPSTSAVSVPLKEEA